MITDMALSLIEKKKLQAWRKGHHCDEEISLSFNGEEVIARCKCGAHTNLSLGIHKDRR